MALKTRQARRRRRHLSVRVKVVGSGERPRLNVFRSLGHIYAQVINDQTGETLAAASSLEPEVKDQPAGLKKTEQARHVGQLVAQRALAKGIRRAVFDRGGYRYQGRVQALAEAARQAGLEF